MILKASIEKASSSVGRRMTSSSVLKSMPLMASRSAGDGR